MNIYEKYILPRIVHCVCGLKPTMRQRGKIIPYAQGVTLEIGIGSGLNIPYYDAEKVKKIIGVDPTPHKKALSVAISGTDIPVEFIQAGAENLDMENNSINTVVSTYTLCTIPDVEASLSEIKRVLKPKGQFIFCEHGKAPDENVFRTQNRINPLWKRISGGCHLNKDIPDYLNKSGFSIQKMDTMYLPGWKPATYNFWGFASI